MDYSTPQEFSQGFRTVTEILGALIAAVDADHDVIGSLSVDDWQLFLELTKEYRWMKGV